MSDPAALYTTLQDEISTVLIGQEDIVEAMTISLLTKGHILLEGVPGVAKTTTARLFAQASGLSNTRIQMTPDVLPADITGTNVYRESTGEFSLQHGPVFSNVVIADEINRATPKTQSALLEAMQERQVTIAGETLALPTPFMVIATQNPIEMEGTFSLPEAQRDRFQFKLTVELPDREMESELLDRFNREPDLGPDSVDQVTDPAALTEARAIANAVYIDPLIKEYILDLVTATRTIHTTVHGASPRASLAFLHTTKARAAIHGRDYVIPDDVKALADAVLVHRLVLSTDAELSDVTAEEVVEEVLDTVEPPSGTEFATEAPAVDDAGMQPDDGT
jgi:MoxR-like ATPase